MGNQAKNELLAAMMSELEQLQKGEKHFKVAVETTKTGTDIDIDMNCSVTMAMAMIADVILGIVKQTGVTLDTTLAFLAEYLLCQPTTNAPKGGKENEAHKA